MQKFMLLLTVLLVCGQAYGGGFQIALQGQQQIGMAHAGTSVPLNAAALYYNPGAMGFLQGRKISFGVNPAFAKINFLQASTRLSSSNTFELVTPFSLYYTQRLGKAEHNTQTTGFTFGVGVYTPFGSKLSYPNDWVGKFLVQNVGLTTIFTQPTIGYNINERIGIGLGLVFGWGNFAIQRAIPIYGQTGYGTAKLSASGVGFGFTTGLYVEPWEDKLSVGLSYKSAARVNLNGKADFTVPQGAEILFPDSNFDMNVGLPDLFSAGVTYYFNGTKEGILSDKSNASFISLDVERAGWNIFKELKFEYADTIAGATELKLTRNYQNTYRFSIGGQYVAGPKLSFRAGIYYDLAAAPDCCVTPDVPDTDRLVGTAGATLNVSPKLQVDLSLLYGQGFERTTVNEENNFEGTYTAKVIIPGIGLQYSF
ncbi:hypothetical protein C7N43_23505 [Sphingobacteriales bacterium UPWRP_1]|nr:hypothetical protein B6N25_15635 [Sphingobacteriales bacterium TSM_CSS]PSJ74545.1 hypothetical protein C7N43_23505 [Sphingobacteriales bacterium UPWRP_1]